MRCRAYILILASCILIAGWPAPSQAAPKRVLFFLTSHGDLNGTGKKTGFWLNALATPYYLFKDAGFEVAIASVDGLKPPADPLSEKEATPADKRFLADAQAMQQLSDTIALSDLKDDSGYDAIFLPGGHGMLWDCVDNALLKQLLWHFANDHKIIAAVDHGPAAFLAVNGPDGKPLVNGRKVAAYTKEEEEAQDLISALPIYLDRSLEMAGAKMVRAKPFAPMAVQDGNLITGQNPASIDKVAKLTLAALKKEK